MKEIFGSDEKAKKEIDKVILHTVWPNLSSKEPCNKCEEGSHERFKKKPDNCRLAGQTQEPQYEEEGWHWFKEDLDNWYNIWEDLDVDYSWNLKKILEETVEREDKILNTDVWLQLLKTQTTASCGALYNEMDKEFFILGPDQVDLVNSGFHRMMKPKTVEGAAGTGKTISEF